MLNTGDAMSERYTVQQFGAALAVDANTARSWLEDLGIEPTPDRYDARRKWISADDARRVADAHDRVLLAPPDDAPKTIAEAMRIIATLRGDVATLQSQIRELHATLDAVGRQETAVHVPHRAKPRDGHPSASDTLPDGWEAVETFGRQINVAPSSIMYAINRGKVTAHDGRWKRGTATIQHALDPEQQAACIAWNRDRQTS